jgi:hypothetical protein
MYMKKITFFLSLVLFVLGSATAFAQTTYYSKAAATDFNNVATWGTATDGTGTAPASISNADNFVIANSAALNLSSGNATVRQLTINSGTLTVTANTLTVGIANQKNSSLLISGGTLTVSGGTVNVDGFLSFTSGFFNQSGGTITVDPNNNGDVATSTTSAQYTLNLVSSNGVNWTGGTLTVLDPPASTSASHYSVYYNSSANSEVSTSHVLRFGNGTSADAGGNANGFYLYNYISSGKINFGTVDIYGPSANNRRVRQNTYTNGIKGNLNLYADSELDQNSVGFIVGGNITVASTAVWTASATVTLALAQGTGSVVNTNSQLITINGIVRNAATTPTANITSLTINNNSAAGVSFGGTSNITTNPANSLSVSSTLTFTAGRLTPLGGAAMVLGTSAPAVGTLSYTSGGFTGGTFYRWYAATTTGTSISAGTDATSVTTRYPFVNAGGADRSAWIERVAPVAATGILGVTYTNIPGTTTGTYTDGAVTVNTKLNDTWQVTAPTGTPLAGATSFKLQLQGLAGFGGTALLNASTRIIQNNTFVGTHQAGTVTPQGSRIGLTGAELTGGTFSLVANSADFAYTSVASGNWNSPATWSTGVVPTCTDLVNIVGGHTVTVNSGGNVSKNVIIASGGTLVVASGDLTVGCTLFNNSLVNNGTLTVTGGALRVNGNILSAAGSTFNQSGGTIVIDGNDGGAAATSVASGTALLQINTNLLSWTGGTLTLVDPHANATAGNNVLSYSNSSNIDIPATHTIRFGNGTSTDAGGNATNGFRINTWVGSGRITFGNVELNTLAGTNRFVSTAYAFGVNGNFTINAGSEFRDNTTVIYIAGNLVNNGTYVSASTIYLGTYLNATVGAGTLAQTVSGTGTFANSLTTVTAQLASLTVNNTNTAGVTLSVPLTLSGTLNLIAGKVNNGTNLLTLGTATTTGTLSGGNATAYITGPFVRTIATGNANTNFMLFPVGKAAYAPISLAPSTTAISIFRAEAFDTNTGTMDASIMNLAANRRWETALVSGAYTDIRVRVGDANITAPKIPVQAPTAAGAYLSSFGSTATFTTGTPNTVQSINAIPAANYTGFISFAESNICSGTPAPGNTLATSTSICSGNSVTLSVQNGTIGSGVTYQWQSSVNGTTFTDIAGATSTTYTTTPTASLYYRLNVTCSAGPVTGSSTAVLVAFANSVTGTTPGARCGVGAVALSAAANAGATVKWYAAATGGTPLASGTTFTTPSISANTTYYAAAETATSGTATVGTATTTTSTIGISPFSSNYEGSRIQYLVTASDLIASGLSAGNITSLAFNVTGASGYAQTGYTVKIASTTSAAMTASFLTGTFTTVYGPVVQPIAPVGINTLNFTAPFAWDGSSNIVIEICHDNDTTSTCTGCFGTTATVRYTATTYNSVYGQYVDNAAACGVTTNTGTGTSTNRPNMVFGGQVACSSARTAVVATVNTPPALTLSGSPAAVCSGQSTAAVTVTAGATDYNTFVWSPATGVTGTATSGFVFNPAVTTTYTLTASQSGGSMCTNVATVTININPLPNAISVPATLAVCQASTQQIPLTGIQLPVNTLGTGTTVNATTGYPSPYSNYYGGTKHQMLIRASELTALGYQPGTSITQIAFNVSAVGSTFTGSLSNFQIDMGHTTATVVNSTSFISGLSNVLPAATVAIPTTNLPANVSHTLTTPFVWNGTDNIVVQTSYSNVNSGATTDFVQVTNSDPGFVSTSWYRADSVSAATILAAATPTGSGNARPNMTLTTTSPVTITWSPATNLYTDALGTVPYVAGTNATAVYVKSNTAGTTAYTVTSTTSFGCTTSATTSVTVNVTAAPTAAATQTFCNTATVANLVATGTTVQWFTAATGGTALAATTALTNGTTYYASQTLNGCQSLVRTPVAVTINVTAAPTAAAGQTFCNTATVANLVATGTGVLWYTAATGGTALTADTALASGTTYYASQTINGCESATRTAVVVTINVTPAPVAAAQTFCNTATVTQLTATGTGVQWYTAATGGTALAADAALATGTYYASQTLNACESATRTEVAVTVNVTPSPAAVAQTFCNTATVAQLTATGTGVQWYTAATGGTALAADTALATGTYYASQTLNACESATRTEVAVTVNVTPAPAAVAQTFCNTATVAQLTATGTGVQWYAAATGGTALAADAALATGTYYASQTLNACESAIRTEVAITVNVTAAPVAAAQSFCTSATVGQLAATGTAVQWYAAATGGTALTAGTALVNGASYYASQTLNGCESAVRTEVVVTITVVAAPTGDATQVITIETTQDNATIADIAVTAQGTVTWYASEANALAGTGALAADTVITAGTTYYATQTIGDCTSTTVLAVTIQSIVLGKEDFTVNAFAYYPNPVKDVLTVSYANEITSVTVVNLLGQQVISLQPNATEVKVDMSALAQGTYLVTMRSGKAAKTVKIVKGN